MNPRAVAAALLLSGMALVAAGLVAFWVLAPLVGAALTILLGAGLVVLGYRAILGSAT